jgi:hypothetical protein
MRERAAKMILFGKGTADLTLALSSASRVDVAGISRFVRLYR